MTDLDTKVAVGSGVAMALSTFGTWLQQRRAKRHRDTLHKLIVRVCERQVEKEAQHPVPHDGMQRRIACLQRLGRLMAEHKLRVPADAPHLIDEWLKHKKL